jgi:cytoskeletal protein RodZ
MDSLGDMLKSAREAKGLSIEQVSQDTNIAIRFLRGFENEDFSVFPPGESYLLGFLRNYGDYLELDNDKLFSSYRSIKIQETPVELDGLLHNKLDIPKIIIVVVIILLILGGAFFLVYRFLLNPVPASVASESEVYVPMAYMMEGDLLERRFYSGDSVLVPLPGESEEVISILIVNIGDTVSFSVPEGSLALELNSSVTLPLVIEAEGVNDSSEMSSIEITAEEFDPHNPDAGALLRFELITVSSGLVSEASTNGTVVESGTTSASTTNTVTIFSAPSSAYPITLQITFQGYCMFRWEILNERDRAGRNEQYFQRGETLNIQVQNGVRVWASNAAALSLEISGGGRTVSQTLGGAGEVVVCDIRWLRDESGYRLVVAPLD